MFVKSLPAHGANAKRKPWSKKAKEKQEHYSWFEQYLQSESRDLALMAASLDIKENLLIHISDMNNWEARANAYDYHLLDSNMDIIPSDETKIKDASEIHVALAQEAQEVAAVGFKLVKKYMQEYEMAIASGDEPPKQPYLKLDQIIKAAQFGVTTERLVLGEVTSRKENIDTIDYSKLPEDVIRLLLEAKTENIDE